MSKHGVVLLALGYNDFQKERQHFDQLMKDHPLPALLPSLSP
jgi:hypothetical protein